MHTVGEVLDFLMYDDIRLYNACDGKLVAKSRKSLEKYRSVRLTSLGYLKIDVSPDNQIARPYIHIYGCATDISEIRGK